LENNFTKDNTQEDK